MITLPAAAISTPLAYLKNQMSELAKFSASGQGLFFSGKAKANATYFVTSESNKVQRHWD